MFWSPQIASTAFTFRRQSLKGWSSKSTSFTSAQIHLVGLYCLTSYSYKNKRLSWIYINGHFFQTHPLTPYDVVVQGLHAVIDAFKVPWQLGVFKPKKTTIVDAIPNGIVSSYQLLLFRLLLLLDPKRLPMLFLLLLSSWVNGDLDTDVSRSIQTSCLWLLLLVKGLIKENELILMSCSRLIQIVVPIVSGRIVNPSADNIISVPQSISQILENLLLIFLREDVLTIHLPFKSWKLLLDFLYR